MITHPKPRQIFIAALPREIAAMVRSLRRDEVQRKRGIDVYSSEEAIFACAGMGGHRAALAVEAALALGPVAELVSVGWAGACNWKLQVGDIFRPTIVVDVRTGERFFIDDPQVDAGEVSVLATVATPASVKEKERLGLSYYASAVDMEGATIARIARAHEIPFTAIKAISDDAKFELPDVSRFTTTKGQLREAAFGLHVALRPGLWQPVMKLAKSSKLAAGRLQTAIESHILEHRNKSS